MYAQDTALREAVQREGAAWATALHPSAAHRLGRLPGTGRAGQRHPPELDTHDRFGNRVDLVRFHPAYHTLMQTAIEHGLHSSPWTDPQAGAHVARAPRTTCTPRWTPATAAPSP
jgi:putative acyl-CoA dehydrogenase